MIEVLKQALEVLEVSTDWDLNATGKQGKSVRAIMSLRQAIAKLESQEPVEKFCDANCVWTDHHPDCKLVQPEQEPVGETLSCASQSIYPGFFTSIFRSSYPIPEGTKLYTTPPQRTWAGLTDEEAQWLYDNCRTPSNLIDMVEAKLKEKNT